MIRLQYLQQDQVYAMRCLERHAHVLRVITYQASDSTRLGTAQTAVACDTPTLNELEFAMISLLAMNANNRCVQCGGVIGVYTYERDSSGYVMEYPYFFDREGNEMTGAQLEAFVLGRI